MLIRVAASIPDLGPFVQPCHGWGSRKKPSSPFTNVVIIPAALPCHQTLPPSQHGRATYVGSPTSNKTCSPIPTPNMDREPRHPLQRPNSRHSSLKSWALSRRPNQSFSDCSGPQISGHLQLDGNHRSRTRYLLHRWWEFQPSNLLKRSRLLVSYTGWSPKKSKVKVVFLVVNEAV